MGNPKILFGAKSLFTVQKKEKQRVKPGVPWDFDCTLGCAAQNGSVRRSAKIFGTQTELSATLEEMGKKMTKACKGKIVWEQGQETAVVSSKKKLHNFASCCTSERVHHKLHLLRKRINSWNCVFSVVNVQMLCLQWMKFTWCTTHLSPFTYRWVEPRRHPEMISE